MLLPVNELFETIQGEARWTGTPSVFVRLQGCDVGCPWCDTKHTWVVSPVHAVGSDVVLAKTGDSAAFAWMTSTHVAKTVRLHRARHTVITGGEPAQYDLRELTGQLIDGHGHTVQIETSGTEEIRAHPRTWITVSPKIGMPGGKAVRQDAISRANEIKMPVGKQADVEKLLLVLEEVRGDVWLQPISQSERATAICVAAARQHGFKVSIQTHKLMGVR